MVTISDGVTTTSKVEDNRKSLKYPNLSRYKRWAGSQQKTCLKIILMSKDISFFVYVCECNMNLILISYISVIDILYKL